MARVHPTAIVEPDCELADEVEVGPYSLVRSGSIIGPGTTIDAQGEPADKFYILMTGRVAVVLGLDFGVSSNEYIVTTIGQGQMFAWSGMVGNPKYTASGKPLTDCSLLEFDVPALDKEFEQDPRLGFLVMRAVAKTIASRLRHFQLQLVKQHAIRESVE